MMNEQAVYFYVIGKDFTALVRSIWAAESAPDRALRILADSFPRIPEADRIAICLGSKRLEGDSRDGLTLEDDDAMSIHGVPLSLDSVIGGFRRDIDRLEDHIALLTENTVTIASPKGLVKIPRRKADAYKAGEVGLDDFPYRELKQPCFPFTSDFDEPEPEPEPPEAFDSITTDSGWLSPDGRFYPCGWMEHMATLDRLKRTGTQADRQGWIKIQRGEAYSSYYTHDTGAPPTQRQIDMLFDWFTEKGETLPAWITEMDG